MAPTRHVAAPHAQGAGSCNWSAGEVNHAEQPPIPDSAINATAWTEDEVSPLLDGYRHGTLESASL